VSLLDFEGNQFRFIGKFGKFRTPTGLHSIELGSLIQSAIGHLNWSIGREYPKLNDAKEDVVRDEKIKTDVLILSFSQNGEKVGAVCLTNFKDGVLPPLIESKLSKIHNICSSVFMLLKSERRSMQKEQLLELSRARVFSLRIESEEFFLRKFELNQKNKGFVFILGDVANSSPLRKLFGEKFQEVLEKQLREVFDRYREEGLIIDLTKGDEIQISFPFLDVENFLENSTSRALSVAGDLIDSSSSLAKIAIDNLGSPIQFRLSIFGSIARHAEYNPLKAFSYISDSSIDLASRVVSKVANAGECLVDEGLVKSVDSKSIFKFQKISDVRVKGWREGISLYIYVAKNEDRMKVS
jgi:hypothetical protein